MSEALRCYHCNNPVPSHIQLTITVEGVSHPVCCNGCQAVARLILGGGLNQFYKFRDANLEIPDQITEEDEEQATLFDRKELLDQFAISDGENKRRIELSIDGITCAACVWLIEQFVRQLPGVREFWVNLTTHRAELIWDQSTTPLSEIFRQLRKIGFKGSPYSADEEEKHLLQQQKNTLIQLGIAGIGMMQNMMFAVPMYFGIIVDSDQFTMLFRYVSLLVASPVVLYSARPFFTAALRDLRVRHLTMDVPVSVAIGAAYTASAWVTIFGGEEVYFDSVCMFTFFLLLGRYLESRARSNAARSNSVLRAKGHLFVRRLVSPEQTGGELTPFENLSPGDFIELKQGSLIPVDGTIILGETQVNEAALTGEFTPQSKKAGDKVLSGSVNIENRIVLKVTAIGDQSHLSTINRLVDRALQERPAISFLSDKIASFFIAGVLLTASLVALIWWQIDPDRAFSVTLAVLVVTCPCALSLATPTALTVATTALKEAGFIVTRGHVLETLASVKHFIFDKTGTLTQGALCIEHIDNYSDLSEDQLTELAAALEWDSHHPVAKAFQPFTFQHARNIQQHSGLGVEGRINEDLYRLGQKNFALEDNQSIPATDSNNVKKTEYPDCTLLQQIYFSKNGKLLAVFHLSDSLRPSANQAVKQLQNSGGRLSILSGDRSSQVEQIASELGIKNWKKGLTPQQKLEQMKSWQATGESVVMVGDGINDVPVMAGAHLSVAMNNASDLTQLKADAILLNGDLNTLHFAFRKAQATYRIIRQNTGWAIGYNITVLPLAAAGFVPPYAAAIGMSASSLLVVLNAMRLSRGVGKNHE